MKLCIKVVSKASRNGIAGWMGDTLKVRVTAPPERGKANTAVQEVLANALGVPKECVRLIAGMKSTRKVIEIEGGRLSRRFAVAWLAVIPNRLLKKPATRTKPSFRRKPESSKRLILRMRYFWTPAFAGVTECFSTTC